MSDDYAFLMDSPEVLSVVFHPRREYDTDVLPSGFDVLEIPVNGGTIIGGRFYRAGRAKPTILFFHGNGEIVSDYEDIATKYVSLGINFMPVDYRGYGRSTGTPTVRSMLADARAVYTYLRTWLSKRGHTGTLVVMGRSLGSAAALEVASVCTDKPDGLIIESGFADTLGLLRRLGACIGDDQAANYDLGQGAKARAYAGPLLVIHGAADRIIPATDGKTLFDASPCTSKRLVMIEGAGHNDLLFLGFRQYMEAVSEFLHVLGASAS